MVIEEGVVPSPLAMGVVPALFFAAAQLDTSFEFGAADARRRLQDAQAIGDAVTQSPTSLADLAYAGATGRTQTFLIMSLDESAGEMRLSDAGRLQIDWPDAGRSPVSARDNDMLRRASEAIHGQFIADPFSAFNQIVILAGAALAIVRDAIASGALTGSSSATAASQNGSKAGSS